MIKHIPYMIKSYTNRYMIKLWYVYTMEYSREVK